MHYAAQGAGSGSGTETEAYLLTVAEARILYGVLLYMHSTSNHSAK